MGFSEIKKELSKLDKVQLIDLISDLYRKNISVKEYFKFYLKPDEKNLLEEYKDKVREGFSQNGEYNPGFLLAEKQLMILKNLKCQVSVLLI